MSLIPDKYKFIVNLPGTGDREVFPKYDPGKISFTYEKWNDYTDDFNNCK